MMSTEKPLLIYDVVYPPDLSERIKSHGKYDVLKLAKSGMVLCFDSILDKKDSTVENFSHIPKMFQNDQGFTIIMNVDEYVKSANEAFEFVRETGVIGELALWLFQNTVYITELYSKKRLEELEKEESKIGYMIPNGHFAQYIHIKNEEAERAGKEHWCIFVSTHKYLLEDFYLDSLLEVHRKKWCKRFNKKNNNKTRRSSFTKSIRHEVFKKDKYHCIECGATNKKAVLHIDHIIPVSKGGTDELDNLQTLCESCNLAKKNRIINRIIKKE